MDSKEVRHVVFYFFSKKNVKPNPRQIAMSVAVVKTLGETYTVDQIKLAIDYTLAHPPKEGVYSLAYIPFVIKEIVDRARAKIVKEVQEQMTIESKGGETIEQVTTQYKRDSVSGWVRKSYFSDMFK